MRVFPVVCISDQRISLSLVKTENWCFLANFCQVWKYFTAYGVVKGKKKCWSLLNLHFTWLLGLQSGSVSTLAAASTPAGGHRRRLPTHSAAAAERTGGEVSYGVMQRGFLLCNCVVPVCLKTQSFVDGWILSVDNTMQNVWNLTSARNFHPKHLISRDLFSMWYRGFKLQSIPIYLIKKVIPAKLKKRKHHAPNPSCRLFCRLFFADRFLI